MVKVVLTQTFFDGAQLRRPGEVVEIAGKIPPDLGRPIEDNKAGAEPAQTQNSAAVSRPARRRSKPQPTPESAAD